MAERRYGFRFSFAEGCVIVVSMVGASFLVFLFGVYVGRELEAHKAAEQTRAMRWSTSPGGAMVDPAQRGVFTAASTDGQGKLVTAPAVAQEAPKTVVVVTPPRTSAPPATAPVAAAIPAPENDLQGKAETPQPPRIALRQETAPDASPTAAVQEPPSPGKEAVPSPPAKKLPTTGGRWSVQVHATRDEDSARQLAKKLRGQGYAPVVSKIVRDGEVWYRVRVGAFASADEARASGERLRREGKFSQAYPVSN